MSKIKMVMSKKQKKIALSFIRKEKFLLFDGGIRTGKTMFGLYAFADWTILNTNRPVNNSLDDNTYILMAKNFRNIEETLRPKLIEKYNMMGIYPAIGNRKISFQCNGHTVRIMFYGAKDKSSPGAMQGLTARGVFADEVALLDQNTIDTAIGRTTSYKDAKFFFTSNPEGGQSHWYYKQYISNKRLNKYYVHMTMYDNPIMSTKNIEEVSAGFTTAMYKQKVLGLWVVGEGSIYKNIPEVIENKHIDYNFITIGLDEGRIDATVCVAWGYEGETGIWHAFDIWYSKEPDANINKNADSIVNWLIKLRKQHKCRMLMFCETNPGEIHNLIKNHNSFPKGQIDIMKVVKTKQALRIKNKSAIAQRIYVVSLMMANNKLAIHRNAEKLYHAFSGAVYKQDGSRKDDGSSDIDTLDAAEYGLLRYLKIIEKDMWKLTSVNNSNVLMSDFEAEVDASDYDSE